jgi:hypothetical protein
MRHPRPDLLSLADDLRRHADEILVQAETMVDAEAQEMMRTVAASYEKLARRLEHLAV